jgi:hypothetical protein
MAARKKNTAHTSGAHSATDTATPPLPAPDTPAPGRRPGSGRLGRADRSARRDRRPDRQRRRHYPDRRRPGTGRP